MRDERLKSGKFYFESPNNADFSGKPYKSDRDAFFLKRSVDEIGGITEFSIIITDDYHKKYGTFFPGDNYPKLLPKPKAQYLTIVGGEENALTIQNFLMMGPPVDQDQSSEKIPDEKETPSVENPQRQGTAAYGESPPQSLENKFYNNLSYYWLNKKQTNMIYLNVTGGSVTRITITNIVYPHYEKCSVLSDKKWPCRRQLFTLGNSGDSISASDISAIIA